MGNPVQILFLAASPKQTMKVESDREIRTIKERINVSKYRNAFSIKNEWAVTDDGLSQYLYTYQPNIVHFSGHGTQTGELLFEDEQRKIRPITGDSLQALLHAFKNRIHLVVLNACHTHNQARMIAKDIDCVIGMSDIISDQASIAFVFGFYQALGFGESVQSAFDQGLTQIQIKNIPQHHIPQLFTRPGVDANRVTLKELAQVQPTQSGLSSRVIDRPISIFISYAPEDKRFCDTLEKQFSVLKRRHEVVIRRAENTLAGSVSAAVLADYLNEADIVLLLVSPAFMASDSIYEHELKPAFQRREQGLTHVIPIIVKETYEWWKDELFGELWSLPQEKQPVAAWDDKDSAAYAILKDVRRVIDELK
ncbi:hypothetical protein KDI_32350 [Dictyobacter arantiisoli]|uniref:TIR domain-containing protein n=1 Tax=Dictyobacter arantiisoli TaxID=2014874 RepID=A0A5A5TDQ1_9CHLR|nr:hypothetical protein KDI_32350 [Dictyobacter arantiisoli]